MIQIPVDLVSIMASSNRTGLGVNKKRSQQVLKTSIEILEEYSLWAKEENEEPYMGAKDLHNIVYDEWRANGRQFRGHQRNFHLCFRLIFANQFKD